MSEALKPPEIFLASPPSSTEPMPSHREFVSRAKAELATTREEIVERVFDRDQQTSEQYEKYLWDRLKDPEPPTENWTTKTTTTTETVPVTEVIPTVEKRIRHRGWGFKPFVVTATAYLAALMGVNADNLVKYTRDKVIDDSREVEKTVDVEVERIEKEVELLHDQVAVNANETFTDTETVIKETLSTYLDEIQVYEDKGGKITDVAVIGQASDETARPGSLGTPDKLNEDIATSRANEALGITREAMVERGMDADKVRIVEAKEAILTPEQLNVVAVIMEQYGYQDIDSVKDAYRTGQLPPAAMETMDVMLGAKRGAVITTTLEVPHSREKTVVVTIPDKDRPLDPDFLWPIIIPPYPRLGVEEIPGTKEIRRGVKVVTSETEDLIEKKAGEIEDIKLLPEGVIEQEDGTLVLAPEAWAFTRKYQALLREGRISSTLAFRHTDPQTHEHQEIRVLFADHMPSQEEIDQTLESLSLLAQARGAELFDLVKVVTIMPSKGGKKEPKEMGLSIDKKADPSTLGLAIPMLGVIEINTNTLEDMSTEELRHTIIHEGAHLLDSNPTGDVRTIWRMAFGGLPEWQSKGGARREAIVRDTWLWEGIDESGNKVRLFSKTEPKYLSDIQRLGPASNYGRTNPFEDLAEAVPTALNREEGKSGDPSRVARDEVDPLRAEALIKFFGERRHKMRDLEAAKIEEIEASGKPGWSVPRDFPERLSHTFYAEPLLDPAIGPLLRQSAGVVYHKKTPLTSLGETAKR